MKQILLILCTLSLFPLLSESRGVRPVPIRPDRSMPGLGNTNAFNRQVPLHPVGGCEGACVQTAARVLEREAVRAINIASAANDNNPFLGEFVERVPALIAGLQNSGWPTQQALKVASHLTAAAIQSAGWGPVERNNVLKLTDNIIVEGPGKHEQKIKEVERCML